MKLTLGVLEFDATSNSDFSRATAFKSFGKKGLLLSVVAVTDTTVKAGECWARLTLSRGTAIKQIQAILDQNYLDKANALTFTPNSTFPVEEGDGILLETWSGVSTLAVVRARFLW